MENAALTIIYTYARDTGFVIAFADHTAKLDGKGVKNYELKIVAADDAKSDTVVGGCDGGTKRITYTRK